MKNHTVAIVAFYDSHNKILLQDRRGIPKAGGEWGFFGGHIEPGEKPEAALVREVKEELDFDLKEFKFFKKYLATFAGEELVQWVYTARFPGFENLEQHEGAGMKLFTISEIKKLKILPIDHPIIDELEKHFGTNV